MMNNTSIAIELFIFWDNFKIKELTKILQVSPIKYWKKWDINIDNTKAPARHETNWEYSTWEIETPDFEIVVNIILNIFEDKINGINKFVNENDLNVKLCIITRIENKITPALYFNKRLLKFLYDLNAEVDTDMYIN